jgi:hypothetical protein
LYSLARTLGDWLRQKGWKGNPMRIDPLNYLMQMADLSLAFVGFSAIVITLRQALGGKLAKLHMLFVRLIIEGGLLVLIFALIPPALSLTDLAEPVIWRISSTVFVLASSIYLAAAIRRRVAVGTSGLPLRVIINTVIFLVAILAMSVNALGIFAEPNAWPYVLGLTLSLIFSVFIFLQNINLFIQQSS